MRACAHGFALRPFSRDVSEDYLRYFSVRLTSNEYCNALKLNAVACGRRFVRPRNNQFRPSIGGLLVDGRSLLFVVTRVKGCGDFPLTCFRLRDTVRVHGGSSDHALRDSKGS